MYTIKTGLKAGQKRGSEKFYTWKRDVPPKTGWSIKVGQGICKAGRRDIAVEIGTVPPKAGRLTRMHTGVTTYAASNLLISDYMLSQNSSAAGPLH